MHYAKLKFVFVVLLLKDVDAQYDFEGIFEHFNAFNDEEPEKVNKEKCCICGLSSQPGIDAVINRKPIIPTYKYPWIVALLTHKNEVRCGGVLISASHIITAAHCVFRTNMVRVPECNRRRVNTTCFINNKDLRIGLVHEKKWYPSKTLNVFRILPHPRFNLKLRQHDIALIQLTQPVQCSHQAMPACLPVKDPPKVDRKLLTAGWELNSPDGTRSNRILREGVVSEVKTQQCHGKKDPTIICAVGTETSRPTCKGNSGTAILDYVEKKFYAVGIVSHSKSPWCSSNIPVSYTRIFHYVTWIKENVKDLPPTKT